MEIERIIGRLLTQHDCVIIPGFGGFIANPKGATIHPGRHTFAPPYKAVLFNTSLTANDGLLANALAYEKNLSYTQALASIDEFVRRANITLRNKGKVVFTELGMLTAGFEGTINFTQDFSTNYDFNSFGLGEFQSLPVDNTTTRPRTQYKTDRVEVHPAKAVKRLNVRRLAAAAGFALLITLASALVGIGIKDGNNVAGMISFLATPAPEQSPRQVKEGPKHVFAPEPQTDFIYVKIGEDTVFPPQKVEASPAEEVVAPAVKEVAPQASKIIVPQIEQASIHVVAAEYAELNKAEEQVSRLKLQGFDSFIINRKGDEDMYKVGLASFYSLASAKQYISLLHAPLSTKVWIYTDK